MLNNLNIPQMLTIIEASKLTGLAKHHIRQLALKNEIVNIRAGKKILINIEKLIEYLNQSVATQPKSTSTNKFNIKHIENN